MLIFQEPTITVLHVFQNFNFQEETCVSTSML